MASIQAQASWAAASTSKMTMGRGPMSVPLFNQAIASIKSHEAAIELATGARWKMSRGSSGPAGSNLGALTPAAALNPVATFNPAAATNPGTPLFGKVACLCGPREHCVCAQSRRGVGARKAAGTGAGPRRRGSARTTARRVLLKDHTSAADIEVPATWPEQEAVARPGRVASLSLEEDLRLCLQRSCTDLDGGQANETSWPETEQPLVPDDLVGQPGRLAEQPDDATRSQEQPDDSMVQDDGRVGLQPCELVGPRIGHEALLDSYVVKGPVTRVEEEGPGRGTPDQSPATVDSSEEPIVAPLHSSEQYGEGEAWWWQYVPGTLRDSPRVRGLILLNVLAFCFGSNIPVVKEMSQTMDTTEFMAGRFLIAAAAFSPLLLPALRDPRIRMAGLELGSLASLAYVTQSIGLLTSAAGRASFLGTFTVLIVPILTGLSGRKVPWLTWASAATALAGVGMLESSGSPPVVGDIWTFLSASLFGVHLWRSEHHTRHIAADKSLNLIALQIAVLGGSTALWALVDKVASGDLTSSFIALTAGGLHGVLDGAAAVPWLPLLYTGLLSTALCLWIEVVSLKDVSATEAAIIYTTEPLWGAFFAWEALGERWGPTGWLGALLILGASLASQVLGAVPGDEQEEGAEEGEDSGPPTFMGLPRPQFDHPKSSFVRSSGPVVAENGAVVEGRSHKDALNTVNADHSKVADQTSAEPPPPMERRISRSGSRSTLNTAR